MQHRWSDIGVLLHSNTRKRKWDIVIWVLPRHWHFHLWKKYGGKYGPVFLREFWVGPLNFRHWIDPQSASYRWFRIIWS